MMRLSRSPANRRLSARIRCFLPVAVAGALLAPGARGGSLPTDVQQLVEQNRELRALVEAQQKQIDELRSRVDALTQAGSRHEAADPASAQTAVAEPKPPHLDDAPLVPRLGRRLHVSGDAAVVFFAGQKNNQYANDEFRIDDATLRLEAEIAHDTYFSSELQLAKRESRDESFHLGEMFIEFENVFRFREDEDAFNLRAGRMDVPFGEEYQHRDPLDNPLITHSLSDVWGTDEGLELYGGIGKVSYALAVQNGSAATFRDYNSDKAITARIGFSPLPRLHLSASGMRTGDLDPVKDVLSEIWIGNIAFRSIGSPSTTVFSADLGEVDATYAWHGGHLGGAYGRARYTDDDPLADNTRRFGWFQLEGVQNVDRSFYLAGRFSTLNVDRGYPLVGIGNFGNYFFGTPTKDLWRLSLGGGWRPGRSLLLKLEYAIEQGTLIDGTKRASSDQFSAEAAVGF